MSIFVNRIQFNDPKDFDNYPIDLERDFDLARRRRRGPGLRSR